MKYDNRFCSGASNSIHHPTEDALERFLLRQSDDAETEMIESHFLACEMCVERLEGLESVIPVMKVALESVLTEQRTKATVPTKESVGWFGWLTLPRVALAGGLAASAALVLSVSVPRKVEVAANRGTETTTVSTWMPIQLKLDARDLSSGPVSVELVNAQGDQVWRGPAQIDNDNLQLPTVRLSSAGNYLARVFSATDGKQ